MRSGLGGQQWTVPILLGALILLTMKSFLTINASLDVRKFSFCAVNLQNG
mgnify:CR=1 FL=1